jgi:hypothetical protein
MQITVKRKNSVSLDDIVVRRVLDLYPEEKLVERSIFEAGLNGTPVDFQKFQEECEKILIPWQLFLLSEANLNTELAHVESQRQKVSQKLFAKRRGSGNVTSKRIIDRLIRCQNYVTQTGTFPKHAFCGSLKGMRPVDAAAHIAAYFDINVNVFRSKRKAEALAYLIKQLEEKNINVSQGVLTNKILPEVKGVRDVYKGTSGFAIKDEKVPFIFIPSEINPDEKDGRQIYTLIYLLIVVGLEEYEYIINKDFKANLLASRGTQNRIYNIASEFLLPQAKTEEYRGVEITEVIRDELSSEYKITPSAVIVIFRKRGHIPDQTTYEALLPDPQPPASKNGPRRSPSIEVSVRKFNGKYVCDLANAAIKIRALLPVQAQYLLFGVVNKKKFKLYQKTL